MTVAAVDWSGRARGAHRYIWIAVVDGGGLLRLERGRDRERLCDHLVDMALRDPRLAVGLDFGFSLPLWFLDQVGYETGRDIPRNVTERWLSDCPAPFWGRPGRTRPPFDPEQPGHRRTELATAPQAKSIFQIGGAGAVGTGSLRGFSTLARLGREGFHVWPFDDPRLPLVVEIFPRLLTGPVVKSREQERAEYLSGHGMPPWGSSTDDAFDAEVSALRMDRHLDSLLSLPVEGDAVLRREGVIWTAGP